MLYPSRIVASALILLVLISLMTACGDNPTPVPAAPLASTTTPGPVVPTATPAPQPTATLVAVASTEWGAVKGTGTEVKAEPNGAAATIEKLAGFTVVAFQRRIPDDSWFERAGGGWVIRRDIVVYKTELEARRSVPQVTVVPTAVPTYNPNQATIAPVANTLNSGIVSQAQQTQTAIAQATQQANKAANNQSNNTGGIIFNAAATVADNAGGINAGPNNKFVLVYVKVQNNSPATVFIASQDFTIVGVSGYSSSSDFTTFGLPKPLQATNVPSGSYAEGGISFLAPKDITPAKLVWRRGNLSATLPLR